MRFAQSPWWIFLIIFFLYPVAKCDDEKIKRAIYNYQKGPKVSNSGKLNDDHFKDFQGSSPFEQVLAALGLSSEDQSKIHTSVEYWPPDMDREKFYQMIKGEFKSWNDEQKVPHFIAPISSAIKPIFEDTQDEVPLSINAPIKNPVKSQKMGGIKSLSPNYYPLFADHVVSYPPVSERKEKIAVEEKEIPKYDPKHIPQVFEEVSEYPEYPTFTEENPPVNYYGELPKTVKEIPLAKTPEIAKEIPLVKMSEIVKEASKVRTPKIKEVFKHQQPSKFHYILQSPKSTENLSNVHQELPKKSPKIVEMTPKIIMEAYTTTTSPLKSKLHKPKFYIHTSKLPAQPEVPSSSTLSPLHLNHVISSENSSGDDDISMTDAGPVLFPEVTTLRTNLQRENIKSHAMHHEQYLHEVVHHKEKSQQQPRMNKKRKLKKKVKTSSFAQEVVDVGNRGISGTQTPLQPLDVIVVTTIAPKASFTASTAGNYIANDGVTRDNVLNGGITTQLSDGYADPHYSDMIDNLSKLTELSFNTKGYNTEISNDYVPKMYKTSSTTEFSPVTETHDNIKDFKLKNGNSSIIIDENMIAVLNLMKNTSTAMTEKSMEELKKAVVDNDLPKVKKIVRQYVGKRPVSTSTTEISPVTRAKHSRSRFGLKTKVTSSSTESSTITLNTSSSTVKSKNLKNNKPATTVKQVSSTTARNSRQSNRTRPSTTPRSTTSKSTRTLVRRITTRRSIKSTTSA